MIMSATQKIHHYCFNLANVDCKLVLIVALSSGSIKGFEQQYVKIRVGNFQPVYTQKSSYVVHQIIHMWPETGCNQMLWVHLVLLPESEWDSKKCRLSCGIFHRVNKLWEQRGCHLICLETLGILYQNWNNQICQYYLVHLCQFTLKPTLL